MKLLPNEETYLRATFYAEKTTESTRKVALFIQGEDLNDVSTQEELSQLVGLDTTSNANIKILDVFDIVKSDKDNNQTVEYLVSRIPNIQSAGMAMVKSGEENEDIKLYVRTIWSEGPLDTRPKTQLKILACTPDIPQIEQTSEVLTRLLRKAYRRTPTENEIEHLTQYVTTIQADGYKWEAAIQQAIKVILCSPKIPISFRIG